MGLIYVLLFCILLFTVNCRELTVNETGSIWNPTIDDTSLDIITDEGYSLEVNIIECNLNGDNEAYLQITSENLRTEGLTFIQTVPKNYTFIINKNTAKAVLFPGKNESNFGSVSVNFKRVGEEPTTTTEVPTTDVTFPTPANESRLLTVYLNNHPNDFTDAAVLSNLKKSIMNMAVTYSSLADMVLLENITEKNVLIDTITECPDIWHDSIQCAQIIFAVPILINSTLSKYSGYQLKTDQLQIMWNRLAPQYLKDFTIYDEPNVESLNLVWYITVGFFVLIFCVSLIVLRLVIFRFASWMHNKDYEGNINYGDSKKSDSFSSPDIVQETPQLFSDDFDDENYNTEEIEFGGYDNTGYDLDESYS